MMTATLRFVFCLALGAIGFNSAFAQGLVIVGNSLSDRTYNSDVVPGNTVFAVDFAVTNAGTFQNILTWGENSGAGILGVGETFYAYALRPEGTNFEVLMETGALTVANVGTNYFPVPPFSLEAGDLIGHYGRGIPLTTATGGPSICYYNGSTLPMPPVGQFIQLPGPDYPLYNDGGRNYAIAVANGTIPGVGGLQNLNIARSGDGVIVTWPAANTNMLVQTTDLAGGLWTPNTNYISSSGTNILTITPALGDLFLRLGNP
jgi:hypothetical protein